MAASALFSSSSQELMILWRSACVNVGEREQSVFEVRLMTAHGQIRDSDTDGEDSTAAALTSVRHYCCACVGHYHSTSSRRLICLRHGEESETGGGVRRTQCAWNQTSICDEHGPLTIREAAVVVSRFDVLKRYHCAASMRAYRRCEGRCPRYSGSLSKSEKHSRRTTRNMNNPSAGVGRQPGQSMEIRRWISHASNRPEIGTVDQLLTSRRYMCSSSISILTGGPDCANLCSNSQPQRHTDAINT